MPTLFEDEAGTDPREVGAEELKRRSPPSEPLIEAFDETKYAISPIAFRRSRLLRLPTARPSIVPEASAAVAVADAKKPEVLEDNSFFFGDLSEDSEEKFAQPAPVQSFSPMGSMGGIRRSVKSFDFSALDAILASGDFE